MSTHGQGDKTASSTFLHPDVHGRLRPPKVAVCMARSEIINLAGVTMGSHSPAALPGVFAVGSAASGAQSASLGGGAPCYVAMIRVMNSPLEAQSLIHSHTPVMHMSNES